MTDFAYLNDYILLANFRQGHSATFSCKITVLRSKYCLEEEFRWKISVKYHWYFFVAPKTGTGLSCTIYKIPVNFALSLDLEPGTAGNPKKKGTGNFGPFGKNGKKVIPRKALLFSRKNFHRDEPLHMNSFRNFRVFHTNSKRSTISQFVTTVWPSITCLQSAIWQIDFHHFQMSL